MAKLEIQLGADSAELLKGLADSEREIKNWANRVSSLKPKMSGAGIAQYSKETTTALNAEAIALAKATTETQQFKAAQASAAAETAKFRNEKSKSSKVITENSRLYKQLSVRLTEMRKNAQDVGAQFGVNSTQFLKASESVQRLDGRLKAIDSSLGVNTRRVGAYGNALQGSNAVSIEFARIIQDAPFGIIGVGNNIQQLTSNYAQYAAGVRQAAAEQGKQVSQGQILKGALSGLLSPVSLLTIGISVVTTAWTAYTMWSQKAAKASKENESSIDAVSRALKDSEYSKAVANVNELRINIDLAKKGFLSKKDVLEKYNETIGKTTGEVNSLDKAEIALAKNADAFIKMTLYKAAAQIALEDASKKAYEAEISRRKKLEDFSSIKESTLTAFAGQGGAEAYEQAQKAVIKAREKRRLEEAKISEDAAKEQIDIAKKFQEDAAKIAKENNFNFFDDKKTTKDNVTEVESRAKKIAEVWKKLSDELKITNADIQSSMDAGIIGSAKEGLLDKAKEDLKSYQKAWEDLIKLGFKEGSKELATLTDQILLLKRVTASKDLLPSVLGNVFTNIPKSVKINPNVKANVATTPTKELTDEQKFIQRSIRASISNVINESISALSQIGEKNLEIERKYSELRRDATTEQIALYDQMEKLEKSLSTGLLATINSVFGSLNKGINDIFIKSFSDSLSKIVAEGEFKLGGLTADTSKALVAGASIAGGILSGMTSKTSKAGQAIGSGISMAATGAATGVAIGGASGGLPGAAIGLLVGAISGLIGASKAKKQEELQRQQLEVQKRQLEEQKRANALAYSSAIIGQMTNQGLVTGLDRNALGDIVFRIEGQDLVASLKRAEEAGKRGR